MANKYLDYSGLQELVNKMKALVKVTGVKGNAESSYRTGNVNITPEQIGALRGGSTNEMLNPFAPESSYRIWTDRLENAFYFADKRWTVTGVKTDANGTETALTTTQIASLFDMSEGDLRNVPANGKLVVTLDFSNASGGVFPNYPYGYVYLNFYNNKGVNSVTARVYGKHTGSEFYWRNLSVNPDPRNATTRIRYIVNQTVMYNMQKLEITINGGNEIGSVSDISYYMIRADKSKDMPYVSKLRAETLYYNLTAPKFIGALQGNADTATNASKVNNHTVNADVPSDAVFTDTTYEPATASADGLMSAEDKANLDALQPVGAIPSCDLDTLTETMVGQLITANTYTHAPTTAGTLEVVASGTDTGQCAQRLYNGSSMYYRYRSGSGFGDWYKVTATKV